MTENLFGFIGLGNMGCPMAQNIVSKNIPLIVYDLAGTKERSPDKAIIAESNLDVAQKAKVIALSLPNIESNESVIREIADVATSGTVIVDTCTIGPQAAAENKEILEQVTELISSKKENVKGTNTKKVDNQSETKIENKENNNLKTETPTDSLVRSELRKWINKNAEEIAKDIIKENITIEEMRKIIRTELARIFFDLYRKRSTWERLG